MKRLILEKWNYWQWRAAETVFQFVFVFATTRGYEEPDCLVINLWLIFGTALLTEFLTMPVMRAEQRKREHARFRAWLKTTCSEKGNGDEEGKRNRPGRSRDGR